MANPWRGEIDLVINGETVSPKITLNVLAELEDALGEDTLFDLIERFESAKFTSRDLSLLVFWSSKAAGWSGSFDDILDARFDGGIPEVAQQMAKLLKLTFGKD